METVKAVIAVRGLQPSPEFVVLNEEKIAKIQEQKDPDGLGLEALAQCRLHKISGWKDQMAKQIVKGKWPAAAFVYSLNFS